MIMDKLTEFCDSTSAILNVGNAIIGNVIALNSDDNTLHAFGTGKQKYLVIQVDTTFVGATATITFELRSDSVAALTTSPTTHVTTGAIAVATLVAGYQRVIPLPQDLTYEAYIGMWETVATANVTAGAISAFITGHPRSWKAFADRVS